MEAIDTRQVGPLTVSLHFDEGPHEDPRDYTEGSRMLCAHRRYNLGDGPVPEEWSDTMRDAGWAALVEQVKRETGATVVLPLRLYDHSGLSMTVGRGAHPMDPGGWDSGTVGLIYDSDSLWGDDVDIEDILCAVVAEYDAYLRGKVYGWTVTDAQGDPFESCWGYLGESDYAMSEGVETAEAILKQARERYDSIPTDRRALYVVRRRYAMLEWLKHEGRSILSAHDSLEAAAVHHEDNHHEDGWAIERVVDLYTGREYEAVPTVKFVAREREEVAS